MRVPLVGRPTGFAIALMAASLGLFLMVASLAELASERRLIIELMLVVPILLYALASSGKRLR